MFRLVDRYRTNNKRIYIIVYYATVGEKAMAPLMSNVCEHFKAGGEEPA